MGYGAGLRRQGAVLFSIRAPAGWLFGAPEGNETGREVGGVSTSSAIAVVRDHSLQRDILEPCNDGF